MSPEAAGLLRRAAALVYVADLETLAIDPDVAHHLNVVLRLGPSEPLVACDGHGAWRSCTLSEAPTGPSSGPPHPVPARSRERRAPLAATLRATGPIVTTAPPGHQLTVGFAMTKGDRPEWTVQKLTEIGVDRILPLLTARTVVRLDPADATKRGERLRRVAREAASQSRRLWLPEVADPMSLTSALAELGQGRVPVLLAEPGGEPLANSSCSVLVGPEGGWDPDELEWGTATLGLGPTVLRSETAAVVAAALLAALRAGVVHAP